MWYLTEEQQQEYTYGLGGADRASVGDVYRAQSAASDIREQSFSEREWYDDKLSQQQQLLQDQLGTELDLPLFDIYQRFDTENAEPDYGILGRRDRGQIVSANPNFQEQLRQHRLDEEAQARQKTEAWNRAVDQVRQNHPELPVFRTDEFYPRYIEEAKSLRSEADLTSARAGTGANLAAGAATGLRHFGREAISPEGAPLVLGTVVLGAVAPVFASGWLARTALISAGEGAAGALYEGIQASSISDRLQRLGMSEEEVGDYIQNRVLGGAIGGAVGGPAMYWLFKGAGAGFSKARGALGADGVRDQGRIAAEIFEDLNSGDPTRLRAGLDKMKQSGQPIPDRIAGVMREIESQLDLAEAIPKSMRTVASQNDAIARIQVMASAIETGRPTPQSMVAMGWGRSAVLPMQERVRPIITNREVLPAVTSLDDTAPVTAKDIRKALSETRSEWDRVVSEIQDTGGDAIYAERQVRLSSDIEALERALGKTGVQPEKAADSFIKNEIRPRKGVQDTYSYLNDQKFRIQKMDETTWKMTRDGDLVGVYPTKKAAMSDIGKALKETPRQPETVGIINTQRPASSTDTTATLNSRFADGDFEGALDREVESMLMDLEGKIPDDIRAGMRAELDEIAEYQRDIDSMLGCLRG